MAIRVYKRTSAGRRNASVNLHTEVTRSKPEKSLCRPLSRTGGRNCQGKLTVIQQGGGHKRRYRLVDFKRRKDDVEATVTAIEYDPNRSCHIALLTYADGDKRYILAPKGIRVGQKVISSQQPIDPVVGNCMPLKNIPAGLDVHCVELVPMRGGAMVRSAGMSARLTNKEGRLATLVLPSGEIRQVLLECRATIGAVGNRPRTRGVAMSHHQHPHGGGEGRSKGGQEPSNASGTQSKGGRTRRFGLSSDDLIIRRRFSRRYGQLKLLSAKE
jgi:large subunit ribosomal protein L2